MTEHYVTLFDSTFLPQGLALHASLIRHGGDFRLWVIAMDQTTELTLNDLDLANVTVVPLQAVESPSLLDVKPTRSIAEYCWTLTPFTPDVVFELDADATRVTYIDADMWLLADPAPLFSEMTDNQANALITPHAYSDRYLSENKYGEFCVQFMPFTRSGSEVIRRTWQQQCLDWCYSTPDATRFGDQKYLDAWPATYGDNVRVLSHPEWTQAPWNVQRFASSDAITFHFHRLRLVTENRALLGLYAIPRAHIDRMYRPYLQDIRHAVDTLAHMGVQFVPQAELPQGIDYWKSLAEFRLHNVMHPTARRALNY